MKKVLNYLPQIVFAAILIVMGAVGKFTANPMSVALFEQINMFGLGEQFGRLMVGFGQLFAGVGVFFKPTRKIAAVLGMAIMAGAIFYHIDLELGFPTVAIVTFLIGLYIYVKGGCKGCGKKCKGKTCEA